MCITQFGGVWTRSRQKCINFELQLTISILCIFYFVFLGFHGFRTLSIKLFWSTMQRDEVTTFYFQPDITDLPKGILVAYRYHRPIWSHSGYWQISQTYLKSFWLQTDITDLPEVILVTYWYHRPAWSNSGYILISQTYLKSFWLHTDITDLPEVILVTYWYHRPTWSHSGYILISQTHLKSFWLQTVMAGKSMDEL